MSQITHINRKTIRPADISPDALAKFAQGIARLPSVLAQLGWPSLRPGQDEVVKTLMMGYDVFAILPTATGKTGCYVVPTLCMGWRTIIISPLLALMRDQAQSMQRAGIAAAAVNSDTNDALNAAAMRDWASGQLQIMIVSPERVVNPEWLSVVSQFPPDFIAMDEAHTFAQWADTFRAGFKFAGDFIRATNPVAVSALTATCPEDVEREIRKGLGIQNARRVFHYPRRSNLILMTFTLKSTVNFPGWVVANCRGSTIVYCSSTNKVEKIAEQIGRLSNGRPVFYYHGKMPKARKKHSQDAFMDSNEAIMVATNAFGMGVDKPNVRHVVHRDMPGTLNALAQEVGRAGRDGEISHCHIMYDPESERTQRHFNRIGNPTEEDVRAVVRHMDRMKLPSDHTIRAKRDLIAERAGVDKMAMSSIMTFLYGEKIVEEVKDGGRLAKIKFAPGIPSLTPTERSTMEAVVEVGVERGEWIEFDLDQVAEQLNLQVATVGTRLNSLAKAEKAHYVRSDSRKPIRIVGDINRVDFTRLNEKHRQADEKLRQVLHYIEIPDEEKHGFIERNIVNNEAPDNLFAGDEEDDAA